MGCLNVASVQLSIICCLYLGISTLLFHIASYFVSPFLVMLSAKTKCFCILRAITSEKILHVIV